MRGFKPLLAAMTGLAAMSTIVTRGESTERVVPEDRGLPPDRVYLRSDSQWYQPPKVCSRIEVWIDGVRRPNDVSEYCVSEGWLVTIADVLHEGVVEARWRAQAPPVRLHPPAEHIDYAARAAAKQARKAERNRKLTGARTR